MYVLKYKIILYTKESTKEFNKIYENIPADTDASAITQIQTFINNLNYAAFPELFGYEYDKLEIRPEKLIKTSEIELPEDMPSKYILKAR